MQITKNNALAFQNELNDVVKQLAAKHGLSFVKSGCVWSDVQMRFTLTVVNQESKADQLADSYEAHARY